MLGLRSLWKGQTAMPFRLTRIPYISAAFRVVTVCLTASNTFITFSFRETKKAPDIFAMKTASALEFHILFFLLWSFRLRFAVFLFLDIAQPLFEGVLRFWLLLDFGLLRREDFADPVANLFHRLQFLPDICKLPGKLGKGVLVSPTVHGNTIVGPTAIDIEDREGTNTTAEGLNDLIEKAGATVENLPIRQTITSFAGLRAHEDHHEFVIGEAEGAQQFIDCAGIESPGLTSSPAIGLHVSELMRDLMGLREKEHFIATRRGVLDPKTLSKEDYQKLIHEKPAYGQIICRCEQVTEGEILDAIHRPLGAKSLDGVKRRTRAGMGRCQAGFCSPRVMEILARELHVDQSEITKCGGASRLIVGTNKDKLEEVQDK